MEVMPQWIAADNSEIRSHLITIITTLLCPASIVALMLALTIGLEIGGR